MNLMRAALGWALLLSLGACGTAAGSFEPASPGEALDAAAALLDEGRVSEAQAVLGDIDEQELFEGELERYELLSATALYRSGSYFDAFKLIRNFADQHRFSDLLPQVEELHYSIGATLAASDGTAFLPMFGTDKEDGEIVLREFVERYGGNPHVADALRILGDLALDEKRWYEARRRFEQIAQEHPSSEWVRYARFKISMCAFAALIGAPYDFEQMRRARNELRDYLRTAPERPEFLSEASDSLNTVEGWMRDRYRMNAAFYNTVGSRVGERNQLERLVDEFPDSKSAERARDRLEQMDKQDAASQPEDTP